MQLGIDFGGTNLKVGVFSDDGEGTIEIFPKFKKGLKDLEGFSHIIIIYHFHKSSHSWE